ncbi:MAG: DNA polymerase III subunit gamma/tau [bacterium]|nr:DNA polymerase III subunit gamma/tau [bacterium]
MADAKYLVIARKWRPQSFEDVVGQQHITRTLQNAITSGRIGHAFLFIGARGIGKTTTARVLSKALNCESTPGPTPDPCGTCSNCTSIAAGTNIDVMEIDGASNNGVDDIRQLRENIRMVPSRSRYKIYVIDEVHQLSTGAFNALLKTLEEPPEHAVFMLATTEAHKVPATIISRCQRYDFRRVGLEQVMTLLRRILEKEGVRCSDEALQAIARAGDGSIRDSESILEQLVSYCGEEITFDDVFDVLGLVDWKVLNALCQAVIDKDIGAQLTIVEDVVRSGKDLSQLVQDILHYLRNVLVCKTADPRGLLALPEEELALMQAHAERIPLTSLIRMVEQFATLSKDFDSQLAQRIALESLLIRVSKVSVEMSVDSVLEKLVQLGAGGLVPSPSDEKTVERSVGAAAAGVLAPPPSAKPIPAPPAEDPSTGEAADSGPESPEPKADPEPAEASPKSQRIALTMDNAPEIWLDIAHAVSEESLNLGVAFGHGRLVGIEDGVAMVEFAADQDRSYRQVEARDARPVIAEALKRVTTNVTDFRLIHAEAVPEETQGTQQESLPHTSHVTAADAQAVLDDPGVSNVVDVFKGRIVDVKRGHAKPPETASDS